VKLDPITEAERDAINAEDGMLVFNSDSDSLEVYAGGSWPSPGAFCGVNLNFLVVQGTPTVNLTPPTTMTGVNTDGSSFSVGFYAQNDTYTTTTGQTIHMEHYLDREAQADVDNGMGMAFASANTGAQTDNIAGYNLRPNSPAGPGLGLLLDAVSGAPALTNMTIPTDGSYIAALDLNHTSKTCAFKDNQAQTAVLSTKVSAWEAAPVYITATSIAGNVLGASIESTWNPGTQADQLPTVGSVRPCEAS